MTGRATARSRTAVRTAAWDPETYLGFVRLYVLCRAGDGPISSRGISEELAHRGLMVGAGSLPGLFRGLARSGYLTSEEIGSGRRRHTVYRATGQGQLAIEQAQRKLRRLLTALNTNQRNWSELDKGAISR